MEQSLPDPWLDLRSEDTLHWGEAMERQLAREVRSPHRLGGRSLRAVAKCGHCDDVLYGDSGNKFVLVHLTWSERVEPPFPRATDFDSWDEALAEMKEHGEGGMR